MSSSRQSSTKIVLVTWDSCSHCHTMLDNVWNPSGGVREQLANAGYVIIHEKVPAGNEGKVLWARENPNIKDYVTWYPTILKYKNGSSDPEVYGAVSFGKKPRYDRKSEYTTDDIVKWASN